MATYRTPEPPQNPRDKRDRRYGWFRTYNDFVRHPKWRVVARMANVSVAEVVAIAADLMCTANKSTFRGNVSEFKILECAEVLSIPAENVARVYAALEDVSIGWIDQEWLVEWYDRQPDKEDPTAIERQRRCRLRAKARLRGQPDPFAAETMSRVTGVTKRDVTLDKTITSEDEEKSFENLRALAPIPRTDNGKSGEKPVLEEAARRWLLGIGTMDFGPASKIVAERLALRTRMAADMTIRKWIKEIGNGDVVALAGIIFDADQHALNGDAFEVVVKQRIEQHAREAVCGPALPLPITGLKSAG